MTFVSYTGNLKAELKVALGDLPGVFAVFSAQEYTSAQC